MKCVVMQPTFFPWAGYFNLISEADCFVFLDDAQLEKQSWQTRNRILVQGKVAWINIPVLHRRLDQSINQTEVFDQSRWRQKLVRQLAQGYARHEFRGEMVALASRVTEMATTNLAEINISLISHCCEMMGIVPKVVRRSSELGVPGRRTARLIGICESLSCDEYLSPAGAAAYLAEDGFSDRSAISLSFQNFVPPPYNQTSSPEFVSHLSILDVVASIGWAAASRYVKGYSQPVAGGNHHD